jgi:hypothetical protein
MTPWRASLRHNRIADLRKLGIQTDRDSACHLLAMFS